MLKLNDFELYIYTCATPTSANHNIFFAHANGVPSLTYKNFFEKMAKKLNVNIVSYDMRGIGKTRIKEEKNTRKWSWQTLVDDHVFIFEQIKNNFPGLWILSGHSLGAWLSLLSSEKLAIKNVWLLDPPILPPNIISKWMLIYLLKKKHLNPNTQKVKKRKTRYNSYEEALSIFKQSSFMKNWEEEVIRDYIDGSFSQQENFIELRHNPNWEGQLFEDYPFAAAIAFLKLSFSFRHSLQPIFYVGENSDTCNPKAKLWVQLFFPKLKWEIIEGGSHMFPIEMQEKTLDIFAKK